MKKFHLGAVAALALGVIGFFMRKAELASVFDAVTGLPERGAAESVRLYVLTGAAVVIACAFGFFIRSQTKNGRNTCKKLDYEPYESTIMTLCAAAFIGAAVVYMQAAGSMTVRDIFFALLAALSGVCLFLTVLFCRSNKTRFYAAYTSVVPPVFFCYWLVLYYKESAASPVLLVYAYQTLALIFSILTTYYICSAMSKRFAPAKTAACCFLAVYFNAVAYADGTALYKSMMFGAVALIALVHTVKSIDLSKET